MSNITRNIGAILVSLLLHLYFYGSDHIKKFDYLFYDFTTLLSQKIQNEDNASYAIIVDIDEKSLREFGQWPWPRVLDAKLIDLIKEKIHPSAIGVNIVFPERDRDSPVSIEEFYKNYFDLDVNFSQVPDYLKDNDKLLSNSLKESDATLAMYFNNNPFSNTAYCQSLSYKNNILSPHQSRLRASFLVCNHESIQNGIENFGFANAWPDSDGIFRRSPLYMHYKEGLFPSFALATILSFDKNIKIETTEDTLLINFSQNTPNVISASDVLFDRVSLSESAIAGKVVILGSSVVGIDPFYSISNGKKISNSMINAFVIENILNETFLTQPEIYKQMNLLLSFLLSVVIIILFSKKFYLSIVMLSFSTALLSLIGLLTFYDYHLYISIGYLWMPLLYFFVLMLLYHAIVINKEQQEQEKFLIRQSKLASIGEMISLIAHQWRQPLSAINGIVLNIDVDHRKKILDHSKLDTHLNKIEDTTAYLSQTINDFTDFFSKNKIREYFYIEDVLTQMQQLTAIADDKDMQVTYKKKENIEVLGYRSELLQSLIIILNNAMYACKKNLAKTKQGHIIIDTYALKENLMISIEDNGGGIDAKDFKKIFDPYFTTKRKPHGTGLGLYILKLIVEDSMNGKVSVRNAKEGAIFMVQIPINPSVKLNR